MMEYANYAAGIIGTILALLAILLAWRKDLLNSGMEKFKELYRVEMDEYKENIRIEMNTFKTDIRGYINKNEDNHRETMNRIVELYQKTSNEVLTQTNICRVIQAKREGTNKYEDAWKQQIEEELTEVKNEVKHIRGNHEKDFK